MISIGISSSQGSGVITEPNSTEKENWFYGTGNVDNTSTPRNNIQSFFEYFRNVKYMQNTLGDPTIYPHTSFFDGTQFQVSSNAGAYTPLGNITGSFTSGQVAYANGANSLTSSSGLLFSANALTIGTSGTPGGLS